MIAAELGSRSQQFAELDRVVRKSASYCFEQ